MLKLFDAVLIIPLYETFIILGMIVLDVIYIGEFQSIQYNMVWFWLGVILCIIGMFVLMVGQKNQSFKHSNKIVRNTANINIEFDEKSPLIHKSRKKRNDLINDDNELRVVI
eukprot:UN03166